MQFLNHVGFQGKVNKDMYWIECKLMKPVTDPLEEMHMYIDMSNKAKTTPCYLSNGSHMIVAMLFHYMYKCSAYERSEQPLWCNGAHGVCAQDSSCYYCYVVLQQLW